MNIDNFKPKAGKLPHEKSSNLHDPITGLDIDPVSGRFIYPDETDDFELPPEVFIPGFHD